MTTTSRTLDPDPQAAARPRTVWRRLTLHYVEMVLAMFAGMLVFGGLRALLGLTVAFDPHPGAHYLLMATDMAIGMAAWMRLRRHGWACTLEMCAAMYAPAVLVPLVWAGAMSGMAFMTAAHVLMMVAMLAVLLRRRREYHH
ncbi:LPXTG cell wall anchor domain-containing protein [Actinomadura mexicana]|uniref:Flagellar biosynthetic protein FliP n=1 Tax=Actinomadura mexicana TaxID=134959 RepID=A0A238XMT2_9ACTN|nr:LPXTG cell wall anchor domain-containing protein [Actinomadura mexicana]SNR60020.1 flagellar biosynthetic protein FliP [Actinomadura mexicana]